MRASGGGHGPSGRGDVKRITLDAATAVIGAARARLAVLALVAGVAMTIVPAAAADVGSAAGCQTWATVNWSQTCDVSQGANANVVVGIQDIVTGACGGSGIIANGYFDSRTTHAVQCWQRQHGLAADGIVGPATWLKMFLTLKIAGWSGDWTYWNPPNIPDAPPDFRTWGPTGRTYVNWFGLRYVKMDFAAPGT